MELELKPAFGGLECRGEVEPVSCLSLVVGGWGGVPAGACDYPFARLTAACLTNHKYCCRVDCRSACLPACLSVSLSVRSSRCAARCGQLLMVVAFDVVKSFHLFMAGQKKTHGTKGFNHLISAACLLAWLPDCLRWLRCGRGRSVEARQRPPSAVLLTYS